MTNYIEPLDLDNCILFFCNTGCVPCDILEEELSTLDVLVYKINIQEYLEVAKNYDVTSIPTLIFMKNNKNVFQVNGVRSIKDIRMILTHYNMI